MPQFDIPDEFIINDNMVTARPHPIERIWTSVEVLRGPNIKAYPETAPLSDSLERRMFLKGRRQHHNRPHHACRCEDSAATAQTSPKFQSTALRSVDPGVSGKSTRVLKTVDDYRRLKLRSGLIPRTRRACSFVSWNQGGNQQSRLPESTRQTL